MDPQKTKIGRNEKCPCGSGKKFKKCHFLRINNATNSRLTKEMLQKILLHQDGQNACENERKRQQGLANPIVSIKHKDIRFVAVGNNLHSSKNWNTFHDFLFAYIITVFGKEWFKVESKKQASEIHPIFHWYKKIRIQQSESLHGTGTIKSIAMTGTMHKYLLLAYNLYLIAHNVELHTKLIKRLKLLDHQFRDAYIETVVHVTSPRKTVHKRAGVL